MKKIQDLEKRIKNIEAKLGISYFKPETIYFQGFKYKTIKSETGRIWLDRNIGASKVSGSLDDSLSYGGYFSHNNILCPPGYRLPTEEEWETERDSWDTNDAEGAFNSPLKLPTAGYRSFSSGSLFNIGFYGYYWSGIVSGSHARNLFFSNRYVRMGSFNRVFGLAVRLIKH